MKLTILKEKLKQGINIIERISSKSLTLPILNMVLIKTQKNFINLSATDLEIGINWWSLSRIEKEGEIVVPISPLSHLFSLLPKKQVNFYIKENFLIIECDNFKSQIKGISSEEFPIIPKISKEIFIELNTNSFCQGLNQIIDIPVSSQTRPEISGIYFSFSKDILKIVATDSFRLGEKTFILENIKTSPNFFDKQISFILPQKTAREVINIFNEKNEKIKIYFSPNQVMFESQISEISHPEVQLISRLIEGEYPSYQEIIPQNFKTTLVLNRNEFLNQIKIAALFSGKINEIKLKVDSKKSGIEIHSQNIDLGEHQSFLPAKIKGKPLEISFNQRFLIDGLLNIKSSEVIFELNKEEGPAVLKPVGDSSYLYVVMPIKSS